MITTCHNSEIIKDKYNNTYCSYCLKHSPKPIKGKNWTLISIFLLIMLGIYSFCYAPNIKNFIHFNTITQDSCSILSDSALIKELYQDGCILIPIAVAQAKLESGINYNSNIAQQNSNIFGIKWHKCKYVQYSNLGHAVFKNWKDCCKCYVHIQNRYLNKIDKHYAMDSSYITIIKQMK